GAVVTAPEKVRVWFTEAFDLQFSALGVYAAGSNERVDRGDLTLESDGALSVTLHSDLPPGAYIVRWRVFTPGDGHETSGAYSFGVGVAAGPAEVVATERTLLGDMVRFVSLSGLIVFVGVAVFRWAIQLEDERRLHNPLFWIAQGVRVALGLGILGSLYLQTSALDGSVLDVLGTQWGRVWLLRAALTAAIIVRANALLRGRETAAALFAGLFLVLTASFTSHSAAKFGWVGVVVDGAHLLSASVWSGGVLCAAIALRRGERKFLAQFAVLATAAVGGLAASGVWLGIGQVGSWAGLLLTEYGRVLLMKLAVATFAFGLGAVNALKPGRILPVAESLAAGIVIACAAVLTNLPPAYSQTTDGAPTRLEQTLSTNGRTAIVALWPARMGANSVEVRLADLNGRAVTGATLRLQFVPVEVAEARAALTSDLPLAEIGGGLYSASGVNLIALGEWQMLLAIDESTFLNFPYTVGPDAAVRLGGAPLGVAVQAVAWLNRYAVLTGASVLLLGATGWSWLAWRSLRAAEARATLAVWIAPGLLLAGAIWLWLKLSF
ncbi:MAG TPA: copper resistance protein CopC, partial [Anaerolineales bacterium]|nr:copper resistance protein CopC [Anaerolineales bacterium]